jgi:hypothetical protein
MSTTIFNCTQMTPPLYRFPLLKLSKQLLVSIYKDKSYSEADGLSASVWSTCRLGNKNVHYHTHNSLPTDLVLSQTKTIHNLQPISLMTCLLASCPRVAQLLSLNSLDYISEMSRSWHFDRAGNVSSLTNGNLMLFHGLLVLQNTFHS